MTSGPKIVHIETLYVETDAINFRDVVQHLTGKNSSTTNWDVGNGASCSSLAGSSDYNKRGIANGGVSTKPHTTTNGKKNSIASSMLLMNVSFKDFEDLLSDMPPMEELLKL